MPKLARTRLATAGFASFRVRVNSNVNVTGLMAAL